MNSIFSQTGKIYDEYVKYYNNTGSTMGTHISVFSEFIIIEARVNDFKVLQEELLEEAYRDLHHVLNHIPKKLMHEKYPNVNIEPFKVKLTDAIKAHELNLDSKNHIFKFDELASLKSKINELFEGSLFKSEKQYVVHSLDDLEEALNKVNHSQRHIIAIRGLNYRILDEYYPNRLRFYGELSDREQFELRSTEKRVGAPLREDVPQDEIEQIVKDLLEKYEQGERIETNRNGRKMMFQVVHEDGRYKGRANKNQIFKYFEIEHPNLLSISDRQFKDRIKKALPMGMK